MEGLASDTDTLVERKARGAFFTPEAICRYLASWAIRSPHDRVLEPSCGDAAILVAAGRRLHELGQAHTEEHLFSTQQIHGVELHSASAIAAAQAATLADVASTILVGDFFDLEPDRPFDAVVGNPPYIRYQQFTGASRAKAQRRALELGKRVSGLASSWAPFVLHASQFLAPGGRMALVLPAELLSVNYAAPIRSFLLESFCHVELVMFEERVFPKVSEEVVLLLAEKGRASERTNHFHVRQLRNLLDIDTIGEAVSSWTPMPVEGKWLPALLAPGVAGTYKTLTSGRSFTVLGEWGSTYLGAVTGNNRFFTLTARQVDELQLSESDLLKISPPGSRHLRGLTFTEAAWEELDAAGAQTHLFFPSSDEGAASRYIAEGREAEIHLGYKCRSRKPWWRVPVVPNPDVFLTYMNHDAPRLVKNSAGVMPLNSVHGVSLTPGYKRLGRDILPLAAMNSMSLLGAELVGRSYGGGMLKLEPKEADQMPVPGLNLVKAAAPALKALASTLSIAIRKGDLDDVVEMVDQILLVEAAGLKQSDVAALRVARRAMFSRRSARS